MYAALLTFFGVTLLSSILANLVTGRDPASIALVNGCYPGPETIPDPSCKITID